MNINKVRRVLKAQLGLQTPFPLQNLTYWDPNSKLILFNNATQQWQNNTTSSLFGNPFMKSSGIPVEGKSSIPEAEQVALLGMLKFLQLRELQINNISDAVLSSKNPEKAASLMATGKGEIVNGQVLKKPLLNKGLLNNIGSYIGQGADFVSSFIPREYSGKYGSLQQGGDKMFDLASDTVMKFNPLVGGIMKAGGLVSDVLTEYAGMGTDNMTKTDAILGSKLQSLTPWGMANGFFGKKTQDFHANKYTIEQVGGSYGGSVHDIANATEKANKKYGLFSSGARKRANRQINDARRQLNIMTDIADEASDRFALSTSDLNHLQYGFNLNGGYDLRYIRAAKFGASLKRVKKINFHKQGGEVINLNKEWVPEIIEPVELFEEGGSIEWQPEILLEGGKVEWNFDTWFNSIPELNRANLYDYKLAFEVFSEEDLRKHAEDPKNNHLRSVSNKLDDKGRYPFLKLGKLEDNLELLGEFDWYNKKSPEKYSLEDLDFINNHTIEYDGDRYYYIPKKFKEGGKSADFKDAPLYKEYEKGWPNYKQGGKTEETSETEEVTTLKNVIPEGALHAHKHNMENAEDLTKKGIPVVDEEGSQQAEIERDEIIFTLEVTKKLEELYNQGTDEAAIEAGKLLVKEILFNTEDKTGLIAKCENGGVIDESK